MTAQSKGPRPRPGATVTAPSIEDIILAGDTRHMTALRPHLPERYVETAARAIIDHPGAVLIVTGFYIAKAGLPETDGPPGAAALGGALESIGREVAYVTDRCSRAVVEGLTRGRVIEFPIVGHDESAAFARELLAREQPALLVAIERPGLVGDGTYRNYVGADISPFTAKTDYLFDGRRVSIGIGDGGNELGMGALRAAIPTIDGLPANPCVTQVTHLIVASVSNWGAYGLVAGLSRLVGRNLLPPVEKGRAWVSQMVALGAVDGVSGERRIWVDGRPPEDEARCLHELHALVIRELERAGDERAPAGLRGSQARD